MEFDAAIRVTYLPDAIGESLCLSLRSMSSLWDALNADGKLSDLYVLDFAPHLANYSWSGARYEVSISFIHGRAHEICLILLRCLHDVGFDNVEAFLFSDECEYVFDESGSVRRVGERMFFDGQGGVSCSDALDFSE